MKGLASPLVSAGGPACPAQAGVRDNSVSLSPCGRGLRRGSEFIFRQTGLPHRAYHPRFRSIFLDFYRSASYNTGCQKRLYMQEARQGMPDRSLDFRRRDGSLLTAVKPKLLHQLGDALRSRHCRRRQEPTARLVEVIIWCVIQKPYIPPF